MEPISDFRALFNATQGAANVRKILHVLDITEESLRFMTKRIVARATKPYRSALTALLRLFSINDHGHEALVATSSPIPKVAAMSVCRLLEQPSTITPSVDSLKEVFRVPGQTAWASATAPDAQSAALRACLQHDMKATQGVLMIITLSPDCAIVASMKSAMDVIHRKTPSVTARALVLAHDEALCGQVRVQVLLTGL